MKITAHSHPGPWKVYRDGEELLNVYSLDTVTGEWESYTFELCAGTVPESHQARAITLNGWRVDIWTKDLPPEIPPPCWDARPIDTDRAMAAVRAMCG